MGAGGQVTGIVSTRLCRFLGAISYPLYITHYPLIYIYTAWAVQNKVRPATGALWGAALVLTAIAVAYGCLRLYDEPLRAWLGRRFLVDSTQAAKARVPQAAS